MSNILPDVRLNRRANFVLKRENIYYVRVALFTEQTYNVRGGITTTGRY